MTLKKLTQLCAGLLGFSFLTTTASAQGIFWKAERQHQTIYICGSVHVAKPDFYPLPDWTYDALKHSDVLIQEVADLDDKSTARLFREMSQLPDGQEIYDLLDEESTQLATKLGQEYGMPLEMFRYQQPWSFITTLTMAQIIKLGYQPQWGVDIHFLGKARAYGIPVEGFETAAEQLQILQTAYRMDDAAFVKESLREFGDTEKQIKAFEQSWQDSNAEQLASLINESFGGLSEVEKVLLLDRNKHWAEQLTHRFKDNKQIFIVVGAGHLAGNGSLIELLREAGFQVQQIK